MRLSFDKARWSQESDGFWIHLRILEIGLAQKFLSAFKAGKQYIAELKEKRTRRSRDANAYYWTLLGQLAAALHITSSAAHNLMLRRYGQLELLDDKLVYVVMLDSEEADRKAMEAETYHVKPTSQTHVGTNGLTYRTYKMLKGSHLYDTKEMTTLINGLVDECKLLGIETKTPEELALMMARWDDAQAH